MKRFVTILFFIIISIEHIQAQNTIYHYTVYYGSARDQGQQLIILRKFRQLNKTKYFAVNVNSLQTLLIDSTAVSVIPATWYQLSTTFSKTPYYKAIAKANAQSFSLQDAGLIHGFPKEQGITLTIDLCPSHKPLDRSIFSSLVAAYAKVEQPVPVALSISGKFLLNHQNDINWLKQLEINGQIKITWINHTFTHYYSPKEPLADNFLLKPGTNISYEVLALEKALLSSGSLPSVFFRFPGLVSDNTVVQNITGFGLIPIGSDAWLAKGQTANNGSIVLIHGNGNEPLGVQDFIKLLNSNKNKVLKQQWLMYDLGETVKDEFQ
ncbi:polysaccharide deacetylase family protein [Pedobacter chitinilyticus]|uniref:Polysaccharide deacetylase n=1 Tax=Pedobacter chitinilyticus TaxID=2233776 RepID=A0A3S3SWM3_9SPHI|nr:polysaccharide deacetylase [Pedobacter chitinilyticus]RWU10310.1 polysaccharide deacetylase [Pedobacter chitinilyticus]